MTVGGMRSLLPCDTGIYHYAYINVLFMPPPLFVVVVVVILFLFSPILIFRRYGPQYQYAIAVDPFFNKGSFQGIKSWYICV